jgi:hypothetical protein
LLNLKKANNPTVITPIAVIIEETVPDIATHAGAADEGADDATKAIEKIDLI